MFVTLTENIFPFTPWNVEPQISIYIYIMFVTLIEKIPPFTLWNVEPQISMHALISILTLQTLKLIRYIKNHKVIILIDSGSTHNFIHQWIVQETQCYNHVVKNF